MTGHTKRTVARVILTLLTVAAVGFIFYNSSLGAADSSEESGLVTDMLNSILSSLHINLVLMENIVRKLAHFTEYSILGTLLSATVYSCVRKRKRTLPLSLCIGAVIPICDELIQLFSAGRSCEVRDMLIDFVGLLLGSMIVFIVISVIEKRASKKGERIHG